MPKLGIMLYCEGPILLFSTHCHNVTVWCQESDAEYTQKPGETGVVSVTSNNTLTLPCVSRGELHASLLLLLFILRHYYKQAEKARIFHLRGDLIELRRTLFG